MHHAGGRKVYYGPVFIIPMVESKYTQVSLPSSIIEQVDRFLEGTADGYSSRAEFVKVAIREKLERSKPEVIER